MNQRALEGDSRMPKKAAGTKFEIQKLHAVLQCFLIDWNRLKPRMEASENSDPNSDWNNLETEIKGSVIEAYTQTKCTDICVACALDDVFSDFNTARKAEKMLTRKS